MRLVFGSQDLLFSKKNRSPEIRPCQRDIRYSVIQSSSKVIGDQKQLLFISKK